MSRDPTKIDHREVENWLTSRGASGSCPSCGEDDWIPPDRTFALQWLNPDGSLHGRAALMLSVFVCTNCAFLRLHAPGLLKPRE